MSDVLDALIAGTGVTLVTVAAIEGIPDLLTDGDPDAVEAAWAATEWTSALGGLDAFVKHDQRLHPWEPYKTSSSSAMLAVMDASGTNADTFGLLVFRREGMASTRLTADVDPGDTSISVQSTAAFSGTGTIYVGCEAIEYGSTTATTFGTLTRGKWSPFQMEGGANFERTHRAVLTVPGFDPNASTTTTVADAPLEWRGRWVGIWVHRVLSGGVLDTRAEAHLLFAGRIASVRDSADGKTIVQIDEVRDAIGDAVIMREQFSAKIRPVITLTTGMRLFAQNGRDDGALTTGTANPLAVVASGAASVNEIDAGRYSASDLASRINDWLASEKAATRLIFVMTFNAFDEDESGAVRSSLRFSDPTAGNATRFCRLSTNADAIGEFYGWHDRILDKHAEDAYQDHIAYSTSPPRQVALQGGLQTLEIFEVQGSFIDQTTLMPPPLGARAGVVRIGTALLTCDAPTIANGEGTIVVTAATLNAILGAESEDPGWRLPVSADGAVMIEQVLFLSGTFKSLMLTLLASTGGGDNWTDYDLLPEQASAAIPYDLLGTGLEAELAACPGSDDAMTVVVEKPTQLTKLLDISTVLRLVQFVWRQGRIALRGWPTPTSAATLTIAADSRATPIDTEDTMSAVTDERDDLLRNVIKIRFGSDAFGEDYRHLITIVDPGSAGNYGSRPLTLDARNGTRGTGIAGEDVPALVPTFAAGLTFLTRPMITMRIPIDQNLLETATAGEVCLFTDTFARDPATGQRGITARPAVIVANRIDWGGVDRVASGEIDLMIPTRLSLAPYCPCAQVDDTATNAGYVVATKVLTCYAHKHSEASAAADASYFVAGSKVRVIEIDPSTAGAPTTWDDVVASQTGNTITLTTGLAGWDNTKRYRVYSDDYSDATTAQRANAYQADDADGQVADLRAPYGMTWHPIGQVDTFTPADPSTELPARPPTAAYGDGKALDTGHARDLAHGINSIVSYHTPQQPQQNNASATYSGSGAWTFVHMEPVHIGIGVSTVDLTHKLYIGPTVSKAGAATADIRVTLALKKPRTADPSSRSRNDIVRVEPYEEHTFTTSSATRTTMAAVAFDTSHLASGHNQMPGIGWLYVEVANHATFYGIGTMYVGPLEAP